MAPEVIPGSRRKAALIVLLSVVLAASGLIVATRQPAGSDRLFGFLAAAFFGLCAIVGALKVARPGALEIGVDAVTFVTAFGQRHVVAYADVERFFVLNMRGARHPAYRYKPGHRSSMMATMSRGLSDADGSFGGAWTLRPAEIVDRLNARASAPSVLSGEVSAVRRPESTSYQRLGSFLPSLLGRKRD